MNKKYFFDKEAADKAVRFIENFCTHTKGELGGRPFILEPWQKETIVRPLFGWKNSDGTRKYRTAFIFLPRKNGKSTLAAAIILALMFIDNEAGAEYYSAANDREQAKLVFEIAKGMVDNNPKLSQLVEIFKNSIVYNSRGSFYKAISRETGTKHGFNVSAAIYDELHAMKESDGENLWQVLETATGARRSPLLIAITTAGTNKQSACFKMYEYAKRVRDGVINDPAFLPVIFEADPEDDITKESTWKKANPCYGVSLKRAYMEREALKAQTMPSYENLYRRLHLNQWVTSETRWLNDSDWCGNSETVSEELLKKSPCWGGLDLASVRDLTSFCLVWDIDGLLVVKHWTFIPEEKAYARKGKGDGVNYLEWSEILEITGGNVTDYNFVKAKILQLAEVYKIKSIAFDRWNASQLVIELTDKNLNMSPFGMGYKSLSPPTKHIEAKVLEGQIVHFGCPVLRWQISNVQVATDPAGNIKPAKDKSTDKIDTVMAMIMATGEMIYTEKETQSVYQDRRGFLTL